MTAADALTAAFSHSLKYDARPMSNQGEAEHFTQVALAALRSAGFAVIELPTVAFKVPGHKDADYFRQVANRLEDGRRWNEVGGSNVRAAASSILRQAADAAEARP